jgi:tRNA pseudouridine38-40 synthase
MASMPRFTLTIEYDGTPYAGFQAQGDRPTVQTALEAAIHRLSGETLRVRCAGRTDTGVHATGQVIHVDLTRDWPPSTIRDALNAHLRDRDEPIAVLEARLAPEGFDARFSATRRHYLYRIVDRRPSLALDRHRAWHCQRPLDVAAMNAGAAMLLGHHDFTTFRAAACQSKSPEKTLDHLEATRTPDGIAVTCHARSFLHSQVRSMVGALRWCGEGRWTPQDVRAALDARDRNRCPPLAPPHGLYLTRVDY